MKQLRGRLGHHDPSRRRVRNPRLDPPDALRIGDLPLEAHEWPVVRPDELLRTARIEEGVDVRLRIRAALSIGRRELHKRVAAPYAAKDFLETRSGHAARRV